ncbi:MAG: hypothetical protein ACRC8A_12460 [Microcoleaceae cyanobacterium]
MHQDYYGLGISTLSQRDRWRWQIALPYGVQLTSNEDYPTAEQALAGGKQWIRAESVFNSLNGCLSQFYGSGALTQVEYSNLLESLRGITQRC